MAFFRAARLSSGQKQRLSIARALAKPAPILLADEPTGNLDAENSAKIIALLAEAAKERLVILITHEFSEAEDYVTRHIVLQDGKIAADTTLRPAPTQPSLPTRPARSARSRRLGLYVAGVQLRSRPVWAIMMLCFFALTAFAVFAFLGTFIVSLDDTSTRLYDNTAFRNGDQRRIVVVKEDASILTQEDLDTLLAIPHVESVERYGYLRNYYCAWRLNVDYRNEYFLHNIGSIVDIIYEQVAAVTFQNTAVFMQTVPVFSDPDAAFLTAGRLPENIDEVVATGDESLIGQTFPIYIQDRKNWTPSTYIFRQVTVVGVTDYGSGLYFHADIGRGITPYPLGKTESIWLPSTTLQAQEAHIEAAQYDESFALYQVVLSYMQDEDPLAAELYRPEATIRNPYTDSYARLTAVGAHVSTLTSYYECGQMDFDTFFPDVWGDQFSLTISDYAYTDRVLDAIEEAGYVGLSPFRESSTEIDPTLASQRMQTLRICLLALLAVLILQVIVLRAMFGTETESYRLLRNIGLNCKTATASVLWQMLFFTLLGQLLALAALLLGAQLGVARIVSIMRYLPLSYAALLSAVHLLASALTALWMMRSLRRQVYPFATVEPDLKEVS